MGLLLPLTRGHPHVHLALRGPRYPGLLPPHGRLRIAHLPVGQRSPARRSGSSTTSRPIRAYAASPPQRRRELAGHNPESHQLDLLDAIDRGDFPSWTLKVQIMPVADAAGYRVNPFDLTKVWPHADYPLDRGRPADSPIATPTTTSPTWSRPALTRGTSYRASVPHPTRCSKVDCSPTAMPIATVSASITPNYPSTPLTLPRLATTAVTV